MAKESKDQFSEKEAQQRFEAAIRGAKIVGPKPMKSVTPKRKKAQRKTKNQNQRP